MAVERRWVSDAEYRCRYAAEVSRYVARCALAGEAMGPGETYLFFGRWAWIKADDEAVGRWRRYARDHRGLKAMNPDGTWRDWEPRGMR